MVNYLHYFTNNVKNYVYHDLHIYSRYKLSNNKITSEINPKCIIRRVSLQPIGRQPPKDTANQHQGWHALLFSYHATRDARIKFWDFGQTGILWYLVAPHWVFPKFQFHILPNQEEESNLPTKLWKELQSRCVKQWPYVLNLISTLWHLRAYNGSDSKHDTGFSPDRSFISCPTKRLEK